MDKENVDARRESGKGILKSQNHTVHLMQLPLRDTQVKDAGKKSYRRRVSFAPEVTLHKIDLIQPMPQPKIKEPRRRETIAFAPITSPTKLEPPFEDNAEEIMYDSSDVEMEDDSHVYSSPGKLGFKIHEDKEYTETIDMSISKEQDNEEENTMELTRPLGEIQSNGELIMSLDKPLFQSTQDSASQESESSQNSKSAFGSITSLFNDDDEYGQDGSLEMDLTQQYDNTIQQSKTDESMDETMDITNLANDGPTDKITLQNTLLNKQIDDISMDQTRIYGIINDDGDITQDITQPMNETINKTLEITPIRKTTPLKAIRSHTSETGSPQSSKRKHQPDEDTANILRERINSLTPKKKRKSLLELSKTNEPIIQENISIQERVSFTPLRSQSQRASLINSGKIELASFTDTVPLALSHEQDEDNEIQQEYQPVTLEKFLSDISVEFFDDLNINEDFTVDLKPVSKNDSVDPVEFIVAKNAKLPWIELYSFSCDELQNNMNELKKLFDNLNDEFSEENPQLVKEYYENSSLIERKKMNDRLLEMKNYADKEAESSWYTWRFKLLDELSTRLNINNKNLNDDSKILASSSNEINRIQMNLINEKNDIDFKYNEALIKKKEIDSEETNEVIKLRNELINELKLLAKEEAHISELESEIEELESQEVDTTAIEEEIILKETYIERNSQEPIERLNTLLRTLNLLQSVSGLTFKSINGTVILLCLTGLDVDIKLNLKDLKERELILSSNLPEITKSYLNKYLLNSKELPISEFINRLKNLLLSFKKLHKELFYLGLEFPIEVDFSNGLQINIIHFNKSEKYKVKIIMNYSKDEIVKFNPSVKIESKLIYGSKSLTELDILNSFKSRISNNITENIETLNLIRN